MSDAQLVTGERPATENCLLTLTPDRGPGQALASPFIEGEGLSTIFPPRSREGIKGRGRKGYSRVDGRESRNGDEPKNSGAEYVNDFETPID